MAASNGKVQYNDLVEQSAIDQVIAAQTEIKNLTKEYTTLASTIKGQNITLMKADGIQETESAIRKQSQSISELEKIKKKLIETENKLAASMTMEAQLLAEQRAALRDSNNETAQYVKIMHSAEGSVDQMRGKLEVLRKQFYALSESMRLGGQGQKMLADIQKLDSAVKMATFSTGKFTDNVGNYSSATFQLTQTLRELPAFAYSTQTGIMGISNNLPILADAFRKVKAETGSAWQALKIFGSSLFSFGNIFAVAVGLLTIFSDKIFAASKSTDELNKASEQAQQTVMGEIVQLEKLYTAATDATRSQKERKQAVDEMQRLYPDYLGNLSDEAIMAGDAADAYAKLSDALVKKAIYQGFAAQIGEVSNQMAPLITKLSILNQKVKEARGYGASINGYQVTGNMGANDVAYLNDLEIQADQTAAALKPLEQQLRNLLTIQQQYNTPLTWSGSSGGNSRRTSNIGKGTKDQRKSEAEDYLSELNALDREVQLMNEETDAKTIARIKKRLEEIAALNEKHAKKEADLWMENAEAQIRDWDRVDQERMKVMEQRVEAVRIANDALTLINDIQYNREMQQIENRNKALEASYDMEKKQIESRGLTQQQKANELANLEARREAERKRIDRERITAERRRALQQKGIDIANIISSGALAIVKQLAATPLPAGAPAVALVAATNGIALARAIAAPIPQYKHGTESHPGGLAEVGDGGQHELVTTPDGKKFITPNTSTIMDLPVGAKVKPLKTDELMKAVYDLGIVKLANMPIVSTNEMQQAMIDSMDDMTKTMKGVKNEIGKLKHSTHLHGDIEHFFRMKKIIS